MSKVDTERSRITGKKFNKQNPEVRRHGPMKKKEVYRFAIQKVLNENDGWLSAEQISWKANKYISPFWTQLSRYSVGAILRVYVKDNSVKITKGAGNTPKHYKSTKKFSVPDAYLEAYDRGEDYRSRWEIGKK